MLQNSFKIHDENAVASQNQKSFSSSSNSSIPLKNSLKPALAPRKALGDISANKLNVRASQSDVKDGGPMKPANSRQDFKIISKVPSCKIVETNYPSNNESLIKASSASQIKDTTVDFDIAEEMKCSRRPLKTFEQICQEDAMENVRQNWAPKLNPPGMIWPEEEYSDKFEAYSEAELNPSILWTVEPLPILPDIDLNSLHIPPLPDFEE